MQEDTKVALFPTASAALNASSLIEWANTLCEYALPVRTLERALHRTAFSRYTRRDPEDCSKLSSPHHLHPLTIGLRG
jgi:hypothetical protein